MGGEGAVSRRRGKVGGRGEEADATKKTGLYAVKTRGITCVAVVNAAVAAAPVSLYERKRPFFQEQRLAGGSNWCAHPHKACGCAMSRQMW